MGGGGTIMQGDVVFGGWRISRSRAFVCASVCVCVCVCVWKRYLKADGRARGEGGRGQGQCARNLQR
jgi:hypothetical protein